MKKNPNEKYEIMLENTELGHYTGDCIVFFS